MVLWKFEFLKNYIWNTFKCFDGMNSFTVAFSPKLPCEKAQPLVCENQHCVQQKSPTSFTVWLQPINWMFIWSANDTVISGSGGLGNHWLFSSGNLMRSHFLLLICLENHLMRLWKIQQKTHEWHSVHTLSHSLSQRHREELRFKTQTFIQISTPPWGPAFALLGGII